MVDQLIDTISPAASGRQTARRLVEVEAYRRIMAGDLPDTLSEFAGQLCAWLEKTHPATPELPASAIEDALRETWHRRHDMIGSSL